MKKITLSVLAMLFVTSCGTSDSDIDQAKQEILNLPSESQEETNIGETKTQSTVQKNTPSGNSPSVDVVHKTQEQFIEINPISRASVLDGEVEIAGKTNAKVDKIEVSFSNEDSLFPDDNYTLQTFKPGAETFRYVASSRFQVLDFGVNTYVIKAYSGKEVSETEVSIYFPDEKKKEVVFEEKVIGEEEDSVVLDLPTSESFGEPISLGANSFTYSGVDGLEITKQDVAGITCDTVTETLQENINSWFYWNTCRDIIKEKGINFYVIRLGDEDTYTYEKHYVDFVHNFYAIYTITTGEGVTKDTISDKNDELKEENDTFTEVNIVDGLLKSIVAQN